MDELDRSLVRLRRALWAQVGVQAVGARLRSALIARDPDRSYAAALEELRRTAAKKGQGEAARPRSVLIFGARWINAIKDRVVGLFSTRH